MNKALIGALLLTLASQTAFAAECKFSEGDDFSAEGSYLMGDSCTLFGNIEAVNKGCSKVKVRVSKVTQAFGMRVDATCRINGGEGAAGDVVWLPISKSASAASTESTAPTQSTGLAKKAAKKKKKAPTTEVQ